ncbi:hypothetical protein BGZ80_005456 [Entomortierella chlamydospora]|uniref:FYVE-type domain-containing protein n=1 Tax=Entomortierella chlamydospora TaxID=101097 RepID=A0A9P6MK92_9FUNG|nr:hypothetical protein BGZ80_005456 [Entomortierella chlamydospora]
MYHQTVQNHETPNTQLRSVYQTIHPGASARTSTPHSSRDQTRKEEPTSMQSHMNSVRHDQHLSSEAKLSRAQSIDDKAEDDDEEDSEDDEDYYDDEDNSEYSDESESEDVDSNDDYESDSDQTETEQQPHNFNRTRSNEVHRNATSPSQDTTNNNSQQVQPERVRQLTAVSGAKGMNGSGGVSCNSSADKSVEGDSHVGPTSPRTHDTKHEHLLKGQEMPSLHSPTAKTPERTFQNLNEPKSAQALHAAKAPMTRHVEEEEDDEEDEDEDEEDYDDDDECSEEYDEDEEDYSYSEDDDEEHDEDESLTEYHYDGRDGPRTKAPARSGQHPHSVYYHQRPTKLDVHFLQKRAITKQVVRRSSLTALLGEVSQPEIESKDFTVRPSGAQFGQYQRHNVAVNRRPALPGVWSETAPSKNALVASNRGGVVPRADHNRSIYTHANTNLNATAATLADQHRRSPLGQPAVPLAKTQVLQEPHRPRRTDSGVEVRVYSSSEYKRSSQSTDNVTAEKPSSPQRDLTAKSSPNTEEGSLKRHGVKSEGDNFDQDSTSVVPTSKNSECSSSANGPNTLQVSKPLKSSISCHTFPRAVGKRAGQKHVSWHHSLFPVERVLHVKPSLPSLSCVAVESANATLSQLPSVPVMTKDKVEAFHQSIRSLRTLSRIEIAKMSYKQQGRLELTSPVPISKSASDPIPWWSPARWLKGPVVIDKRHWKPDDSRESCAYCFAPFHRFTNPRHHCRKCGDLFCGKCASAEILMDAKNCVYVQQSQLARWSRRVDLQRHSLWIDTLPQLHPVRTAVESGLVVGSGVTGLDGHGSVGHAAGINNGTGAIGSASMGHRSSSVSGSGSGRRGSWQMAPGASKKSRLSIFGLFSNGVQGTTTGNTTSDSARGSMDISSAENIYVSHYSHLQPQNPLNGTFSTGRRSSSSSTIRSNTAATSSHLMMTNGSLGTGDGGLSPIAMSRRMNSRGVGEVCLARICVGCERELLKPVPRCTSIAKYYGSLNSRGGYRPPPHGYSSLGPSYMGRQHPGPLHPMEHEADTNMTGNHDYNPNGVRRHSPLRQVSHMANVLTHEGPSNGGPGYYNGGAGVGQVHGHDQGINAGWNTREEPVGPYGEARYHPEVLTFQEQQLQYTQQTLGPLSRELS